MPQPGVFLFLKIFFMSFSKMNKPAEQSSNMLLDSYFHLTYNQILS
jgi:hypothetical protein